MRYLLDTHILFWSMSDEAKLSEQVLLLINDPENEIMFSSASVWEVVIKHDKNPAGMPVGGQEFLEGCLEAGFMPLPIENHHVLAVSTLIRREGEPPHNDPFDRITMELNCTVFLQRHEFYQWFYHIRKPEKSRACGSFYR